MTSRLNVSIVILDVRWQIFLGKDGMSFCASCSALAGYDEQVDTSRKSSVKDCLPYSVIGLDPQLGSSRHIAGLAMH